MQEIERLDGERGKLVSKCRPDYGETRPKSRWPKAWKDELYTRERATNLARAKYELHLATAHGDERHKRDVGENLVIIMREGRLKA